MKIPNKYIRVHDHIVDVDGESLQDLIDAAISAGYKPRDFKYMTLSHYYEDGNNTASLYFDKEVDNSCYESEMIAYNKYQNDLLQEQLLRKSKNDKYSSEQEIMKLAKKDAKTNSRKDRLLNSILALRKSGKDPLLQQFLEAKLKDII